MVLWAWVVALSLHQAGAPPSAAADKTRVFFSPLLGTADPDTRSLLLDRLLVSTRRYRAFEAVGATDIGRMLDVEAMRQAMECDDTSCFADVADALDAPQIVSGQLGRVGQTWVLTLSRAERTTMKVLARVSRETQGDTPERLLGEVDFIVDDLFADEAKMDDGLPPLPLMTIAGVVVAGVGVGVGVLGILSYRSAAKMYSEGEAIASLPAPTAADVKRLDDIKEAGDAQNRITVLCGVGAGVLVAGGAALVIADQLSE
jgi:hypothetical protein